MIDNTNYKVLSEIKELVEKELNENKNIGYTMPNGKHHLYIYVNDDTDGKYYVIEPNEIVNGEHIPMGDTYNAYYDDFAGVLVGVMWCIDYMFCLKDERYYKMLMYFNQRKTDFTDYTIEVESICNNMIGIANICNDKGDVMLFQGNKDDKDDIDDKEISKEDFISQYRVTCIIIEK